MADEDKKVVEVPDNYIDPVFEHTHMVIKGESVVTCRLDLHEPQKKVGQKVPCPGCGTLFDVVSVKSHP